MARGKRAGDRAKVTWAVPLFYLSLIMPAPPNGEDIVMSGQPLPTQPRWSAAERETRIALAACYRLVARFRMTDLVYTHISARVPGTEHFLLNPYGYLFEEVTASNLVKIDIDGRAIEPGADRVNPAGFTIHSAVHRARTDVGCVLHTHTRAGMAVAATKRGLLPLSQFA